MGAMTTEPGTPKKDRLRETLTKVFRGALGLPLRVTEPMVDEVLKELRREHGGDMFYVSLDGKPDKAAILTDFDGSNHGWVCRKHGISQRTLYRVLNDRKGGDK